METFGSNFHNSDTETTAMLEKEGVSPAGCFGFWANLSPRKNVRYSMKKGLFVQIHSSVLATNELPTLVDPTSFSNKKALAFRMN